MIPDSLLPHSVVKVRPASSTDSYGDTAYDYGVSVTRTTIAARVEPEGQDEQHDALRDSTDERLTVFTNHTDIRPTDRMEWNAVTYDVLGPVAVFYAGPSSAHHARVTIQRRQG